jgi:hypothetical protein
VGTIGINKNISSQIWGFRDDFSKKMIHYLRSKGNIINDSCYQTLELDVFSSDFRISYILENVLWCMLSIFGNIQMGFSALLSILNISISAENCKYQF